MRIITGKGKSCRQRKLSFSSLSSSSISKSLMILTHIYSGSTAMPSNGSSGHFNDEYELKEELGKGAFSIVRRCVKVNHIRSHPDRLKFIRLVDFPTKVQIITQFFRNQMGTNSRRKLSTRENFLRATIKNWNARRESAGCSTTRIS